MLSSGGVRVRLIAGTTDLRWCLLAGNGRTIGVSVADVADSAAAEASLRAVIAAADELTPSITHPESSVAWTWRALDASGVAVAMGDRKYGRYGTCLSSFARFRAAIGAMSSDDVTALLHGARVR